MHLSIHPTLKVIDLRAYFPQIFETDQHFFETNQHFRKISLVNLNAHPRSARTLRLPNKWPTPRPFIPTKISAVWVIYVFFPVWVFYAEKYPTENIFVQKYFYLCNINYPLPFLGGPKKAIFLHKIPLLAGILFEYNWNILEGGVFYFIKLHILVPQAVLGDNVCWINQNIFAR